MSADDKGSGIIDPENLIVDPNPSPAVYLSDQEKQVQADEITKAQYWLGQVTEEAKQEAQPWTDECRNAWREYQGQKQDGTWRPTRLWWAEVYPRYWSDTELMLPALYSRTPKAISKRKFDSPDPNAKVASIINDRLAAWLISTSDYDNTMEQSALGFLNTSRQTCRLFFEEKIIKRRKKVYLTQVLGEDGNPILIDEMDNAVPDDVGIITDEAGRLYYESEEEEEIKRPRIVTKVVHFDKIRISPGARNPSEIWWMAYEITITKKDAAKLFGDKIREIQNPTPSQVSSSDWDSDNRVTRTSDLFTYWEVWNYRDKEIYWLHEQYKKGFLKTDSDIYHLEGFYPSPKFMLDNMRYDSCYPAPDYTQCKDAYEQIHILYKRINLATRVLKACILFDGSESDLANFFRELSDNQGIGVSKWAEDKVQGGFENKIYIPDYSPIVLVLQQLVQAFERQKLAVDELRGITDLVRNSSDPETTATAEKIKDRRASLRFAKKKKAMLRFAVDTLQMMLDLAYKTFEDDFIKEIVGFNLFSPEDQQRFSAAMQILRDDEERQIRIDIETDSMVLFDDMDKKEQSIQMMETVGKYIDNISKSNPIMLPALIALLGKVIRSVDDLRDAEDPVFQAFAKLSEQASQPPSPPQPNPDLMAQLNTQVQIEQFKVQSNERIEMAKLGRDNAKLSLDEAKLNQEALKDNTSLNIESFKAQSDHALGSEANQIKREAEFGSVAKERMRAQGKLGDQQLEANAQMIRVQEVGASHTLEAARVEIEKALAALEQYKVTLNEQEKWLTEMRLQKEAAHQVEIDHGGLINELHAIDAEQQTRQVEALANAKVESTKAIADAQKSPQIINIAGGRQIDEGE